MSNIPSFVVDLDTPGGDIVAAMEIGNVIRSQSLMIRVPRDAERSSACIFIQIAGVQRWVLDGARIGLHRPHFNPDYFVALSPAEARSKYEAILVDINAYYLRMGSTED
jgi:hypothetical protein